MKYVIPPPNTINAATHTYQRGSGEKKRKTNKQTNKKITTKQMIQCFHLSGATLYPLGSTVRILIVLPSSHI
eukprot:gene11657-8040_t